MLELKRLKKTNKIQQYHVEKYLKERKAKIGNKETKKG